MNFNETRDCWLQTTGSSISASENLSNGELPPTILRLMADYAIEESGIQSQRTIYTTIKYFFSKINRSTYLKFFKKLILSNEYQKNQTWALHILINGK